MSRSLNKVSLIGNVGQEPEIRTTAGGTSVAKVSLATSRKYNNKAGVLQENTQWHRLTFFGRLSEIVEQWVSKGDRLFVEGRIEYSTTEGDDGITRYWTDIIVQDMIMLGSNSGAGNGGGTTQRAAPQSRPNVPITKPDDDLPF